jgi:predicted O-methyltransferase YrrM
MGSTTVPTLPERGVAQGAQFSTACVGDMPALFECTVVDGAVSIRPRAPLNARCTIRPAAMFMQSRRIPDVNTVMGRLVFARGATEPQTYRPFTLDSDRNLIELFLPVETAPGDDWPASVARWRNFEVIAHRLLATAGVSWNGLNERTVNELVRFVVWPEPLEGCILHALASQAHAIGSCLVEVGSFRGRSLSLQAMALRDAGSDALLVSIDPHEDQPHNAEHVRLMLRQLGEENRLVQIAARSDRASALLRTGCAGMVFIDGDHGYDTVVADFENYRDILAPGGFLIFHDYGYANHNGQPEADPEVRPAVDQHVFTAAGFKPLLLAHTEMVFVKTA